MKNEEIVRLINESIVSKKNNVSLGSIGATVEIYEKENGCLIAFLDMEKLEDKALIRISCDDIEIAVEKNQNKDVDEKFIKELNLVELIEDHKDYEKYGVKKGETGCVMMVKDYYDSVIVDFSGVDKNGKLYGNTICVKCKHLKNLDNIKVIKV